MKLMLALCVAASLCACASDAQILRAKGIGYLDGWKDAARQSGKEI